MTSYIISLGFFNYFNNLVFYFIKEEYLSREDITDTNISLLKLRLNEIEDQIVKIVEKS